MKYPVCLLLPPLLLGSCGGSDAAPLDSAPAQEAATPAQRSGTGSPPPLLDWKTTDPLTFLRLLREHPEGMINVGEAPLASWITKEHVKLLMERIDSKTPAAVVVSVFSSYIPFDRTSTEGNEALFLIQGYREGRYPPRICSVQYFEPDREEFRAWWKTQ